MLESHFPYFIHTCHVIVLNRPNYKLLFTPILTHERKEN